MNSNWKPGTYFTSEETDSLCHDDVFLTDVLEPNSPGL